MEYTRTRAKEVTAKECIVIVLIFGISCGFWWGDAWNSGHCAVFAAGLIAGAVIVVIFGNSNTPAPVKPPPAQYLAPAAPAVAPVPPAVYGQYGQLQYAQYDAPIIQDMNRYDQNTRYGTGHTVGHTAYDQNTRYNARHHAPIIQDTQMNRYPTYGSYHVQANPNHNHNTHPAQPGSIETVSEVERMWQDDDRYLGNTGY
eukprot:57654_1